MCVSGQGTKNSTLVKQMCKVQSKCLMIFKTKTLPVGPSHFCCETNTWDDLVTATGMTTVTHIVMHCISRGGYMSCLNLMCP